jgi:phospholipid N-methyltransferase
MILSRMHPSGKLVVFENNPNLAEYIKGDIRDRRLRVIADDAGHMGKHLRRLGLRKADCIVSGLPLGDFRREDRKRILTAIRESLDDKGTFLQFQYFLASLLPIRRMFDTKIVSYVLRNFPPAFVYECRHKAD